MYRSLSALKIKKKKMLVSLGGKAEVDRAEASTKRHSLAAAEPSPANNNCGK